MPLMTPQQALHHLVTCASATPCPREIACATLAVFTMEILKERGEWPLARVGEPPEPNAVTDSELTWEAPQPPDWSTA